MAISREALAARVKEAAAHAGMTQAQLAQLVDIDPSALSRALTGQRNFKSLELGLIAEALHVSVQDLLAEHPASDVLIAARAQPNANPAIEPALDRVRHMLDLDRLLADLGLESSAEVQRAVHGQSPAEQGEQLADGLRADIGLADEDLPYDLDALAGVLERRLGVDVAFEPLPLGLDGLSATCDCFALALVSSGTSATRQRYTLAHELGHLVAGDSQELTLDEDILGKRTPDERRANAFAAAFLMPAAALTECVPRGFVSEELVSQLLARFGVSLDALAFRLHNVGLVNAPARDRIRAMSSSRITLRTNRTADLQARNERRLPGNLLSRAVEAYALGQMSIRPLATLLNVDPEQLLQELNPPDRAQTQDDEDNQAFAL